MNAQQNIKVGDRVRSFDFESRDLEGIHAAYCEGVVTEIRSIRGGDHYIIAVERRVFGGEEVDVFLPEVAPPVNGRPKMLGGVTDGVFRV